MRKPLAVAPPWAFLFRRPSLVSVAGFPGECGRRLLAGGGRNLTGLLAQSRLWTSFVQPHAFLCRLTSERPEVNVRKPCMPFILNQPSEEKLPQLLCLPGWDLHLGLCGSSTTKQVQYPSHLFLR